MHIANPLNSPCTREPVPMADIPRPLPKAAIRKEDSSSPLAEVRKQAKAGDMDSQFAMGVIYESGNMGLEKDVKQARVFYEMAARKGKVEAMSALGRVCWEGEETDKEEASSSFPNIIVRWQAMEWYEKAAAAGHEPSLHAVVLQYTTGSFLCKKQAGKWMLARAEEGNEAAMFNVGNMYFHGFGGLEEIPEKAIEWYERAAEHGVLEARLNLGVLLMQGTVVARDTVAAEHHLRIAANWDQGATLDDLDEPSEEEKARMEKEFLEAEARGEVWIPSSEKEPSPEEERQSEMRYLAMYNLGRLLLMGGGGVKQDVDEGWLLIHRAGENGIGAAQLFLGTCYLEGKHGMNKNPSLGITHLTTAAAMGYTEAQFALGLVLAQGVPGVPANHRKGMTWIFKAAEGGFQPALAMKEVVDKEVVHDMMQGDDGDMMQGDDGE